MSMMEERAREDNIRMNKRWIKKAQRDILGYEEQIEKLEGDIIEYREHIIELGGTEE